MYDPLPAPDGLETADASILPDPGGQTGAGDGGNGRGGNGGGGNGEGGGQPPGEDGPGGNGAMAGGGSAAGEAGAGGAGGTTGGNRGPSADAGSALSDAGRPYGDAGCAELTRRCTSDAPCVDDAPGCTACLTGSGNPCPGADGDSNCSETCKEATHSCDANDPRGGACGSGNQCDGAGRCVQCLSDAECGGGTPHCLASGVCVCLADAECVGAVETSECQAPACRDGQCKAVASVGAPCGGPEAPSECSAPDTCDAQGVCQPNHLPSGAALASSGCLRRECNGAGGFVEKPVGSVCTHPGGLFVTDADLSVLRGVTSITGDLKIGFLGSIRLDGIASQVSDLSALSSLTTVLGDVYLVLDGKLANLKGLDRLEHIGGSMIFDEVPSLEGLSSLATVGGTLHFNYNPELTSLSDLESLTSVGSLSLSDSGRLENLEGLNKLTSIPGRVQVSVTGVASLRGLESLTSVGSLNLSHNGSLTSLEALESLVAVGELSVFSNSNLAPCWVDWLQAGLTTLGEVGRIEGNLGTGPCPLR